MIHIYRRPHRFSSQNISVTCPFIFFFFFLYHILCATKKTTVHHVQNTSMIRTRKYHRSIIIMNMIFIQTAKALPHPNRVSCTSSFHFVLYFDKTIGFPILLDFEKISDFFWRCRGYVHYPIDIGFMYNTSCIRSHFYIFVPSFIF